MSRFQSIDLYDPESPSVDDDLCLELEQSSTCKVSDSAVSCEYSLNFSTDIEDAKNETISATEGSNHLASSQCTTAVHDKQECLSDVTRTDEPVKPVNATKPAVIWKTRKKMLGPSLVEFDDVETVEDKIVKAPLNATPGINTHLPDFDHSQNSKQLQQQCSNSDSFANDRVDTEVCDGVDTVNALKVSSVSEPVTVQKVHACDRNNEHTNIVTDNNNIVCDTLQRTHVSEPGSTPNSGYTNSIVDIAEPTEPCDDSDQMVELSQQPRTIKLSRIEDPLEPDELLEISDPNCNSKLAKRPRIIRLDRDKDLESHPILRLSDISDPSEPTDAEPLDFESHAVIPRKIKLHRVDGSKNMFDSVAFPNKLKSSSLIKPRVIQLNTLFAKPQSDHSNTSPVAEANRTVESSECKTANEAVYCHDIPLSPAESIMSVSDSEHDQEHSSQSHNQRVTTFEKCDYTGVTDFENKCLLSGGTSSSMKSDHSVSNHRYLSEGEIVDETEEEEFGIFQISGSAPINRKEKRDSEQHKKKSEKKRLHENIIDDVGLHHHNESVDEQDHSRSNKRQKVSKAAMTSKSSVSCYVDEQRDRSVNIPTPVQHLLYDKSKTTSKLPLFRKQKHTAERTSRSPEKLLVQHNHTSKRKVVVVNRTVDESKKEKRFECHFSPSITVAREITPMPFRGPVLEKALQNNVHLSKKRTLNKRKHSKRHHKHHTHRNEARTHERKGRLKKHMHRKHRSDSEGRFHDFEQRHNRSRPRSYDRIVEMIRSEEKRSSNVRHLRSVVVHKNTLVSARQRSSSDSSYYSCDSFATTGVSQNADSRSRNVSGGHVHLSRLSYSGELEQDGRTTLLGECIRSKYGPEYDINFISRNLSDLCPRTDDANDEVEIVGVSYPRETQSKNSNLQNADSSESKDDGSDYGVVDVVVCLDQQPHLSVEGLSSATGEQSVTAKSLPTSDIGTNKLESKKVTVSSKEVQTQVSLFAETRDCMTEPIFSDTSNNKPCDHGKADKELQVSDFDNKECIHSPSSAIAGDLNEVSDIQSPENRVEDGSHVPRPVLLERADVPRHTPDSPKQDLSDLYVTVPNISKSLLSVAKNIALERQAENADHITSDTGSTLKSATEQVQLGIVAVNSAEISTVSNAGLVHEKYDDGTGEQLSSKKCDSDVVHSNTRNKELSNHNTSVIASAVHQLPPVVQHKPVQYQRAVPLHPVSVPVSKKLPITVNGHSSTVRLPATSAIQQLRNEPVAAMSYCTHSQQPLISESLFSGASEIRSASAVLEPVSPQLQHENQNKSCSPDVPESLSFFTHNSGRIPGICEDVEPDANHCESRISTSLSSRHNSLHPSSFLQTNGSLGVINVVVATVASTVSEIPQQKFAPYYTVTSVAVTSSCMVSDVLPLSSSQASSTSASYSSPQGTVMPAVTTSSDIPVVQQHIAPLLRPLSGIAAHLFTTSMQQQTTAVPSSTTTETSIAANSTVPAVSSRSSLVTVPALKYATTTVTSTEAISAWITSLPQTTTAEMPAPSSKPPPKPLAELDFDVDAVVSPRSDEIMSFSPPSSEHMMAVVKMKHSIGLKKKSSRNTTNGLNNPNKTESTVGLKILMNV